MNLEMPQFDECYGVEPGTPTITAILDSCERMIPYHSFRSATFESKLIELFFNEWVMSIKGTHLVLLWRSLQMHDVLWVRATNDQALLSMEDECVVSSLTMRPVEN